MILLFPDLDTLSLTLTSGIVPADVTLAPAAVSFDGQGKIYVESAASLSKAVTKNLDRIGVKGSKRHASDTPEDVSCWPQLLPVAREAAAPQLSNQAPVLFELSDADDLPALVTEMLRLGNDRQGFRWFAEPGDADAKRVLLRVIGPPYYTLLRALDNSAAGSRGTIRAYFERAPRVWVEAGYSHPLASQIKVAEGQLLLVRPPRDWVYLDDAAFQDVYDILQFKLPAAPVGWAEAAAPKKMAVPLRLTAGNAADVPELWVLRDNAVEQLDVLVRDSDDRLLQRLMFAVAADTAGNRTVVLRTRPSKLPPPHLPLEGAIAFKPYWKLPNLFVPVGRRLHPTLRRDAVRKLLADDADQVVWLYPEDGGGFTPVSVPDGAFRLLEDWVDYVIESEQQPLAAWIEATRFDFEHFVCKEPTGTKPKPDKGDKDSPARDDEDARAPRGPAGKAPPKAKQSGAKSAPVAEFVPSPEVVKPASEWRIRREALEKEFLDAEGGLDNPERTRLWPELAAANGGEGHKTEAGVCWLNALWDADPLPGEWLAGWTRSELPGSSLAVKAEEFDKRLVPTTGQEEARAAVATFLWVASQDSVPAWLASRLPAVQSYLERHESALPVRAVWLAAFRLSQLSGADVLGLARVRDRLLQRLLDQGLLPERDQPMFLRVAGQRDAERMRAARDKATELHQAVRKWTENVPQNLPYVDLYFAYALAKLQESSQAKKLLEDARAKMEVPVPGARTQQQDDQKVIATVVSNFLFKAFKFRVDQLLAGRSPTAQMSEELTAELDEIHKKSSGGQTNNPYKLAHYVISRMRDQSRVLEPHEKLDPYAEWTKSTDPLKKELSELHAIREPGKLADRIRKLHRDGPQGRSTKEVQFLVLHEALPLAARVGEAFTVEMLQLVPAALAAAAAAGSESPDLPRKQGELLSNAMFLAGHYDRSDLVKKMVDEFSNLIHGKKDEDRFRLINVVGGECLRSLKRLGMRDEIDRFYTKLHSEILRGASSADLRKKYSSRPDVWSSVLQTQLNLAGGWLTFGYAERAKPILDEAQHELLHPSATKFDAKDYAPLARAFVLTVGHGTADSGLARILELYRKMDPKKLNNTFTTAPYYSRFHLNLVEDTIRAVVSDDFALGAAGRKWLDEDEYLVRRRIHADMRRHLDKSGL